MAVKVEFPNYGNKEGSNYRTKLFDNGESWRHVEHKNQDTLVVYDSSQKPLGEFLDWSNVERA